MDPRSARTRQALRQAALQLASERALDEITIGDIAERAGVNRSSFYQHYSDKETLLADALDEIVEEVGASLEGPLKTPDRVPAGIIRFLEHVEAHAGLYAWALGPHGSAVVTARIWSRVDDLVRRHLALAGDDAPDVGVPIEIFAASVAGSGFGAVRAWLESDPRAPAAVAATWIWRMLLGPGQAAGLTEP
ncbi:MAG: TetR/AcrR family transcriptional regulator [Microbacteriaceae bacterium]|nr:TetR/AcrR family transcriptional regulator [Microbacteriaceae bacterium]